MADIIRTFLFKCGHTVAMTVDDVSSMKFYTKLFRKQLCPACGGNQG